MTANAPLQPDEQARLDALARYDVLDTPPEEAFDRLTRLARRLFDVPMSTLTFIDGHRQWFKSRQGVEAGETDKGPAFCDRAMREPGGLVVEDAAADDRFRDNPFVTGEPHIRFYAGTPLRTPDGQPIGTLCAMDTRPRSFGPDEAVALADLGRLVMEVMELRVQASTDALTGLKSRRAFREEAERAVALARRHRHVLSCLMIDLDRFKAINDTYGHAVGDAVLRACAEACGAELRTSDLLGRIGGEEFAALLPMTTTTDAILVAERVRAAVALIRVPGPDQQVSVTASLGIASLGEAAASVDELLAHADAALYRAKAEGRNRCTVWTAPGAAAAQADQRRRVLKAGRISFNAGRSVIDCTVRALSAREAGLAVVSSAGIPDTFKLQIGQELSKACRILAKRDGFLDVAFA